MALYNPEDAPAPASVDFTTLGWRAATTVAVRDLWARASKGAAIGRYPATGVVTVGAHETVLLRLTPQKAVALVEID